MSGVRVTAGKALSPLRVAILAGAAALVVVLLVILVSGRSVPPPTSTVLATEEDEGDDAATDEQGETVQTVALPTRDIALGRDPFQPVRPDPEPDPAPDPDPDPDPVAPDDPDDPEDPTDPPDRVTCDVNEVAVCNGTVVRLADTGFDRVVVHVDGTAHDVGIGQEFADRFRLLSINGDCADFLHGDGDTFRICVTDPVAK